MKPLLVSYSDAGDGAGRATYRLHDALRKIDVDSSMLVRRRLTTDPDVRGGAPRTAGVSPMIRRAVEGRLQRLQKTPNPIFHSANILPSWWSRRINAGVADIVNLHWAGAGTMSIGDIGRISKPAVLSMHDMWGFCGSEHYTGLEQSSRWRVGYNRGNRPPGHRGVDLDRWTWQRKLRHWQPMHVVTDGTWLATAVSESALMSGWPVHAIPTALDLGVFRPADRWESRHALDLPQDAQVVLFAGSRDPRKGVGLLIEALRRLQLGDTNGLVAVAIGSDRSVVPDDLPIPLIWRDLVHDDQVLAGYYNSADVVVVPSRQEALGQFATEAQACGTPVVAFDTTGLRDGVRHMQTGYLAEPFSTKDLARGIEWVLENEARYAVLSRSASLRAAQLWDPRVVASQHLSVFELALDDHGRSK